MAAKSCEEVKKPYSEAAVAGSKDLPVNFSCFELINPSFEKDNENCSLDVLPILIEEVSFPAREKCSLNNSHSQDLYSISVLPEEGKTSPGCTSQLSFLSFLGAPFSYKKQMSLDTQLSCQNCIDLKMENENSYSSCIVDINIEKENAEILKSNDDAVGSTKSDGVMAHMQKVLQRQSSLNTDKSSNERVHEAPTNRWRRYKRAASFDSRKVVLLFSILSSIGTLILIYLTLRVKQIGDGLNHV